MLQAWFSRTEHPQARDPYFLYGASNLGSFVALLAYPVVLEPFLTLRQQSLAWTFGFVLLKVMIGVAGLLMAATLRPASQAETEEKAAAVTPSARDRLSWIALAFVPSAMLLAVTSHISTDIASAPFLWVVPLAIFLATFIFTFRSGGDATHRWMVRLQPFIAAPLVIGLFGGERAYWMVVLVLDLLMLAVTAMICHRELYLKRPDAHFLTGFYLWISVGGVLGGIFAGLVAPALFPDVWEYPILIVLALLCRPGAFDGGWRPWLVGGAIFCALVIAVWLPHAFGARLPGSVKSGWMMGLVLISAYIMINANKPVRLVAATAFVLILTALYQPGIVHNQTARSFFGVHKVTESVDGHFRMLFHGTTLHGVERLRNDEGAVIAGRPEPASYYHAEGSIADGISALREQRGSLGRVCVVGLGTGTMACLAKPDEQWRFFEIDSVVVKIAKDPTKFRFLSECGGGDVTLGDARLTLAETPDRFNVIILDAFSSDVVPVHLLTHEAMALYLSRLNEGGAILLHISNRYLDLASVVAEVAATHGLVSVARRDGPISDEALKKSFSAGSLVAVVARSGADLQSFNSRAKWSLQRPDGSVRPWTDDFSNILAAIWRLKVGQ